MTSAQPLDGFRVLSLAQQLPGPYCGMLLRDLGAEVILVEQIPHGDPARAFPPLFDMVNRSKSSVALNLKNPAGLDAFYRMTERTDIVLEGFRPGVAERLGVDHASLERHRPGLIYCSISGYGQDGQWRDVPGHDLSYQARAGAVPIDGEEATESQLPIADLSSAALAAVSVLGALLERERGGPGRYIDVSMTESVLSFNSIAISFALSASGISLMGDQREPAYGIFPTSDGWITLSIAHEQYFWQALCAELGEPALGELTGSQRRARSEKLRRWLTTTLSSASSASWIERLGAAGVPVGAVNTPEQTVGDPLFEHRECFQHIDGKTYVRPPLRFDGKPAAIAGGPPAVGQDTRRFLLEAGLTDSELERLRAEEAVLW